MSDAQAPTDARDEAAAGTPPTGDDRPSPSAPSGGGRATTATRSYAGWVVAIVALAVAVVAVIQWFRLDAQADARREVAETAGVVLAALTNWQAEDLEEVRQQVDERATDRFRDEARRLFDEVAQGLVQANASSEGEILDLVAEVNAAGEDGERTGVALAIVRQQVENIDLEGPDVACWGSRAVLRQVEGRWLVDGLELYGPNTCPEDLS